MAKWKSRIAASLAVASMAMSLTACSDSASGDGDGDMTIKAGLFAGTPGLPWVVAKEQGFFEKQGLELETTEFTNGPAVAAAVASDSLDVGYMGASNAYQTVEQGSPITVLNAWNQTNFAVLVVNADKATSSIEDGYPENVRSLKGLKIGVPALGGQVQAMIEGMLSDAGLDPKKDVTFIATGATPTVIAALKNGKVDANTSTWAAIPPMEAGGVQLVPVVDASDPENVEPAIAESIFSYDMASADFASDKTKLGKYCTAMHDAVAWILDPANAAAGAEYLAELAGLSVEDATTIWPKAAKTYTLGLTEEQWTSQPAWATGGKAPSFAKSVTSCVS